MVSYPVAKREDNELGLVDEKSCASPEGVDAKNGRP